MEEFNKDQAAKNEIPKGEYSVTGTTEPVEEYSSYKKAKKVSKVTSIAITVIGASLVIGSFLSFALTTNKVTTKVEKFIVEPSYHEINYTIKITETKSDSLELKLHSQFVDIRRTLTTGETIGSFKELTANMKYEISILEKNVVVASKSVTTYAEGA